MLLLLVWAGVATIALAASVAGRRESAGFWFTTEVTVACLGFVRVFSSATLASALRWTVAGVLAAAVVASPVRNTQAWRRRGKRDDHVMP